jgi:protein TonB
MRSPAKHWLVGIGAAVLIHAAVAAVMLRQSAASSARSTGVGGIEVSLGPTGGAPGAAAQIETPPEPEPVQEQPQAQPQPPEPPVEEQDVARKPDMPEPEPQPEPEPLPEPLPQPAAVPPPKPKPPVPDPPRKRAQPQPAPAKEPPPEPEKQVAALPPSVAGAQGKAGTEARPDAGSAESSSGGGNPGEVVDYMAILQSWLEKHKEYPRGARLRRMEGTTLLYFVMDRDGRVLDFRIERSSGYEILDHEVEEMIRRAQPLPPMPDSMKQARLELVVPVQFLLR